MTLSEWLTIAAIVLGPILAVATQLWFQARKQKRDLKLWVFNTLMSRRASWINQEFVQAFNVVDSVYYDYTEIRAKRREFLEIANAAGKANRDLTAAEHERCKDLLSEMLAKMGKELGLTFDHTQIKDTGYYPAGLEKLPAATLAVLEGRTDLSIRVKQ